MHLVDRKSELPGDAVVCFFILISEFESRIVAEKPYSGGFSPRSCINSIGIFEPAEVSSLCIQLHTSVTLITYILNLHLS